MYFSAIASMLERENDITHRSGKFLGVVSKCSGVNFTSLSISNSNSGIVFCSIRAPYKISFS